MKKFVKEWLLIRWRIGRRPSNQLMMIWLKKALSKASRLSVAVAVAVDVGCGKAINRPFFKNRTYRGLDLNETFIAKASLRYPNDKFATFDIINDEPPEGDLYVCTLVFHNKHFPKDSVLMGIKKSPMQLE